MQRFRWVALQGSARGLLSPLLLLLAVHITTSGIPALAADDPAACRSPFARIVSIQGSVEVLRAGQSGAGQDGASQSGWAKVTRLDTSICEGDRLRTGALSRTALFIQPETLVRVDQHTSISISQTAEETLVEFIQEDVLPASATPNACGAGYFITRFPRKFKVNTPHLNAAVEGTEFLVAMRCEATDLSVFEGKVLAASAGTDVFPPQTISSGQTLTIGGAEPPAIKLLVKPADAVQWVLYYPPLSEARAEAELATADQCRSLPKPIDQTCLSQRAELLMRSGQIDQAQREIDEAVTLDSQAGEANALRAVILIARNDKAGALEAAKSATAAAPNAYRTWLALSYAQQAAFKLEDSLESAKKAQSLEPSSSLTNARVAELLMSLGRIKEAERAAQAAVDASPEESRARTVLGFVRLAQIKTKAAREDFQAAIERDSSDPLPRLGLGLAIIRDGKLADGREQLEIAVALDPTNSLLRSYVGKAYYEENTKERDQLAAAQFDLAKQLDRNDPTPWFYASILDQSQSKPVDALQGLQRSNTLNDARGVTRSRLLLDQDRAAQTATTARIYSDLGLHQLALTEAAHSLADNASGYAAHRFLADVYTDVPQRNIARESELLQSQVRQPLTLTPSPVLRPSGSPIGLLPTAGLLQGIGPTSATFGEYGSLFERNAASFYLDGVVSNTETQLAQAALTGIYDRFGLSLSTGTYQEAGLKPDTSTRQDAQNIFLQAMLSAEASVQYEKQRTRLDRKGVLLEFDPSFAFPLITEDTIETNRVAARFAFSGSTEILVSALRQEIESDLNFVSFDFQDQDRVEGEVFELQYVWRAPALTLIAGAGTAETSTQIGALGTPFKATNDNGYIYALKSFLDARVNAQIGLTNDHLTREVGQVSNDKLSPKLGLQLRPAARTTVRAAYIEYIKRDLVAQQTLEPTQVAGFNQFYDDLNATEVEQVGLGLDHMLLPEVFFGMEEVHRRLQVPLFSLSQVQHFDWTERHSRAYLYWAPARAFARSEQGVLTFVLGTEYQKYDFNYLPVLQNPNGAVYMDTVLIPVSISMIHSFGLKFTVKSTSVEQKALLQAFPGADQFPVTERFWITDISLSYALPRRAGRLEFAIKNLFDESSGGFVEIDTATPLVTPTRLSYAKLTLEF